MANLPAKEVTPALRVSESNPLLKAGDASQPAATPESAAARKGSSFNAALAQGTSSPNGAEGTVRPDLLARTESALRGELAARVDTAAGAGVLGSSGREAAALEAGKFDLPVLQLGASDRTVGLLQRALALLGNDALRSDSVFGARTEEAVRSFQEGRRLSADGIVGNRETWPAINQALVTRHEGVARLADAMGPMRSEAAQQVAEMKQLNAVLAELGQPAPAAAVAREAAVFSERPAAVETTYMVRAGETLADIARNLGLPVAALIAANPELSKPYLILQGQLLNLPNPVKERTYRRPPRQLHPADPEGHLASANMNPDFVALVNGMIGQLRGEGYDVRVIAGFRAFAEQQKRFEQGRLSPGKILTDAEPGHSWHNYGLAVDIVLNDEDGCPAWPEESAVFWQRLGDVALAHGAVWGGLFGFPAHVEYHPQFEHDEAGSLIEDFESHGLDGIWERIALELPPEL